MFSVACCAGAVRVGAAAAAVLLALSSCSTPPVTPGAAQDPKSKTQHVLLPPPPDDQGHDSLRFKTGEVLIGEIHSLRHFRLWFESDQLDEQKIDWDDVVELRSTRENTVVLDDFSTAFGTVLIKDGEVVVGTEDGPKRFARSRLNSLVPGRQGLDYWSGKVAFGLTAQTGNTDQVTVNSKAGLQWRSPFQRVKLGYLGNYGKVDGDETANNHRGLLAWRVDLSEEWFVMPARIDGFRDTFQNIKLQATPGAGVGYNLANTSIVQLAVAVGAGWRYTEYDSTTSTNDNNDSSANWIPALTLDWEITSDIELTLNFVSLHSFEDSNDIVSHLDGTLSIDLIDDFDLDISFQWDRVGDPQSDSSGDTPDENDFRYTVGLGWHF